MDEAEHGSYFLNPCSFPFVLHTLQCLHEGFVLKRYIMEPMNAGYSQRPLAQKLGIKAGQTIAVLNVPTNYMELLAPLPDGVRLQFELSSNIPFIHFFCSKRAQLEANLPAMRQALTQNGMIWISWPKKAAKVPTDLDENVIRELGLACGLVDVKVAAVDSVWSGLKFVIRVKDRQPS